MASAPAQSAPLRTELDGAAHEVHVLDLTGDEGPLSVAAEVARRLEGSPVAGSVVRTAVARTGRADPFELCQRVSGLSRDAVAVVVAPPRWGARRLAPGPTIDGRPVFLVQAGRVADLPPITPGPDPAVPWVVAAMAKDAFLRPTEHWATTLTAGGRRVRDLRADRARREDLVHAVHVGPGVVLYAGHGRARGWGGYQALRWEHLERLPGVPGRPAGVVIAFACDTLSRPRGRVPFGRRVVQGGVATAYLGAAGPLVTQEAEALGECIIEVLSSREFRTVAELVRAIGQQVGEQGAVARAWAAFRLVGDGTAQLAVGVPDAPQAGTVPRRVGRVPTQVTGKQQSGSVDGSQ